MKNLIFVLIGFFCFANGQSDSLRIAKQFDQLKQINDQTKIYLKKTEKIEKENQTLIYKIKTAYQKLYNKVLNSEKASAENNSRNTQGIKPFNNEPTIEVEIPDGVDSIRGNFFYRLFHKQIFIIKPFKIVNDEKIYLD